MEMHYLMKQQPRSQQNLTQRMMTSLKMQQAFQLLTASRDGTFTNY